MLGYPDDSNKDSLGGDPGLLRSPQTLPTVTGLLSGNKKKKKKSMLSGRLTSLAANKNGLGGYTPLAEMGDLNNNS